MQTHEGTAGSEPQSSFDKPIDQTLIERYSTEIVTACNLQDYTSPSLDRIAPNFHNHVDAPEGVSFTDTSKAEFLRKVQYWARKLPQRTMEVVHAVSSFDDEKGVCDVWLSMSVQGWGLESQGEMAAESVSKFSWRRSEGVWWCVEHSSMRGLPPMQGVY